jgi:hypothetical protein
VTLETVHEVAMAAVVLKMRPHDKRAAVDRMVADGRAKFVNKHEWELTEAGLGWIGRMR